MFDPLPARFCHMISYKVDKKCPYLLSWNRVKEIEKINKDKSKNPKSFTLKVEEVKLRKNLFLRSKLKKRKVKGQLEKKVHL